MTQSEPQAAADGFDFTWNEEVESTHATESGEIAEVAPDSQEAYSSRDLSVQQSGRQEESASVPAIFSNTSLTVLQPVDHCRRKTAAQAASSKKESLLATELSARLQSVSAENKRKRKEHNLRMKQMKAEHELHMKNAVELHALKSANKKAKLELLQLKIAELNKE